MAYKATPLALEAKALLKRHLHLPDGVAQGHVDTLFDGDLADLVACNDYPLADRSEVLMSVLTRATPVDVPPVATPDLETQDPAPIDREMPDQEATPGPPVE